MRGVGGSASNVRLCGIRPQKPGTFGGSRLERGGGGMWWKEVGRIRSRF